MDKYEYGDWLSCPECGSSEIYVETLQKSNEEKPPQVDQVQVWLRFHCTGCDYRGGEFDASEVMPRLE